VLQFLQRFLEAFFLGVVTKWLLGDEDVSLVELEYRVKRAITFDPTVGSCSNFYRGFIGSFPRGSYGMILAHEDVLSIELEYRLKRAITCDPIV